VNEIVAADVAGSCRSVLTEALKYLLRGWQPVPVPSRSKAPVIVAWQRLRLTEIDLAKHFVGDCNIGLLLGEASGGLVDVDLDCDEAVRAAPLLLKPTAMRHGRRSRPSSHWWYGLSTTHEMPRTVRYRDLGGQTLVELRSTGAQTIVPPSVHPDNEILRWEGDWEPASIDPADLGLAVGKLAAAALIARVWPAGGRHDATLALAGWLFRAGWSADHVGRFVEAVAVAACDGERQDRLRAVRDTQTALAEGRPATGATRLADLLGGDVVAKVRGWLGLAVVEAPLTVDEDDWRDPTPMLDALPAVDALPEHLIPTVLRDWIVDAAERLQVPIEMIAAPALVGAGSLIGRNVGVRPKRADDWLVIANLWGMVVGRPGILKSPAMRQATKYLRRLAAEAREQYATQSATAAIALSIIEQRIAAARRGAVESDEDAENLHETLAQLHAARDAATPSERRYLIADSTTEKMAELLSRNPRGLLMCRDELAGWLRTLDKKGREGDRELYLTAWDGTESYTYDRIGRGTQYIPALCLSILGTIQPGKLRAYIGEAVKDGRGADGLLQRFQVVVWPDVPAEWRYVDRWPETGASDRAAAAYADLDRLEPERVGAEVVGEGIPGLRFSSAAQEVFVDWLTQLEGILRSGVLAPFPAYEAHAAKYRSLMPSLALIVHLLDVVSAVTAPGPIGESAARTAADWVAYLDKHARRVYAVELDRDRIAARAIVARIEAGDVPDGFSVRDLRRKNWLGIPDDVSGALRLLERLGWLRLETRRSAVGRGSAVIRVHPQYRGAR
jgi:putative DNA primase/helicase